MADEGTGSRVGFGKHSVDVWLGFLNPEQRKKSTILEELPGTSDYSLRKVRSTFTEESSQTTFTEEKPDHLQDENHICLGKLPGFDYQSSRKKAIPQ